VAKEGLRVMDSDLHTMEPPTLLQGYLDEEFKKFIPSIGGETPSPKQPAHGNGQRTIQPSKSGPNAAGIQSGSTPLHPHYAVARKRNYDPESSLQAMDIEGVDVAILYATRGRHVQMRDDLDPKFAAALARAYNNWTHDYCATNPNRLKFAALISFHDAALATEEAQRAVSQLGAVAIIGNPNPVRGRHIHDPCFEPFWDVIEGLGVPRRLSPHWSVVPAGQYCPALLGSPQWIHDRHCGAQPCRGDARIRELGRRWRPGAPSQATLRFSGRNLRLAALVALAYGRDLGEIRSRDRRSDLRAPQ